MENDYLPNLFSTTEELKKLKKDLENKLMYHEAAEGPAYWKEKSELAKIKFFINLINVELISRVKEKQKLIFSSENSYSGVFILEGNVDKDFHSFLLQIINYNKIDNPWYKRMQNIQPFFQGGVVYNSAGWILIEFWTKDIENVQRFINEICLAYINQKEEN